MWMVAAMQHQQNEDGGKMYILTDYHHLCQSTPPSTQSGVGLQIFLPLDSGGVPDGCMIQSATQHITFDNRYINELGYI